MNILCPSCQTENAEASKFCRNCGAKLNLGLRRPEPSPQPPAKAGGKSPIVPALLSLLIPGLGQFINGDNKKGLVMLGGAVIFGVLTVGLLWFGIAIWSVVDAYQVAEGKGKVWT